MGFVKWGKPNTTASTFLSTVCKYIMSLFLIFSFSYGMLLFLKQFNAFLFRAFLLELKNEFSSVFIESIIN